jgi:tryptophan 2,3-dioxygenase
MRDYSQPVLRGPGATDCARYVRADALVDLQRDPAVMVHRDELVIVTVHQVIELWLKLACSDANEAANQIRAGDVVEAELLLARATRVISLITEDLAMLRRLAPSDVQLIRTAKRAGSGLESPGWQAVQRTSRQLNSVFTDLLAQRDVKLIDLYRGSPSRPLYRLAEALIDWDERIWMWRVEHYKIGTRTLGHNVGTGGAPVDTLAKLIGHRYFPALWEVRAELSRSSLMAWRESDPGQA